MDEAKVLAQEIMNLVESMGEIRLALGALMGRVERLESRARYQTPQQHAGELKARRGVYVGSVQGAPYTVTATLDADPEVLYTEG